MYDPPTAVSTSRKDGAISSLFSTIFFLSVLRLSAPSLIRSSPPNFISTAPRRHCTALPFKVDSTIIRSIIDPVGQDFIGVKIKKNLGGAGEVQQDSINTKDFFNFSLFSEIFHILAHTKHRHTFLYGLSRS